MKKFLLVLFMLFTAFIAIFSLFVYVYLTDISYSEGFGKEKGIKPKKTKTIKIGVVSRYSPSLILDGYQPIIDYLNSDSRYNFELILSKNYLSTVKQLEKGEIDFAFLGDMVFIAERKKKPLIPVVCPVNKNGKPYLRAVVIVRDNSPIKNFCDLNGKKIALPSPSSFSYRWGKLKAKECGIKVKINQFNFHHTVVLQVLNDVCAGGVVREYVAKEFEKKGVKIIDYSPAIPSPPLVALKTADKKLIEYVRERLLKFKGNKSGYSSIDREFYYGFTVPDTAIYENFEKYLVENGIINEE